LNSVNEKVDYFPLYHNIFCCFRLVCSGIESLQAVGSMIKLHCKENRMNINVIETI
jgi:hypothetical protein